jgi:hypothetical protein
MMMVRGTLDDDVRNRESAAVRSWRLGRVRQVPVPLPGRRARRRARGARVEGERRERPALEDVRRGSKRRVAVDVKAATLPGRRDGKEDKIRVVSFNQHNRTIEINNVASALDPRHEAKSKTMDINILSSFVRALCDIPSLSTSVIYFWVELKACQWFHCRFIVAFILKSVFEMVIGTSALPSA